MIEEKKALTRHIDIPGMEQVKNYIIDGGYEGLKNAFAKTPAEIVAEVKK